jgi:hypothetical protein
MLCLASSGRRTAESLQDQGDEIWANETIAYVPGARTEKEVPDAFKMRPSER